MLDQIKGLHHVTSLASSAQGNNAFFTGPLGLRRVKKTVNFDAPDVYHLYYGDETGTPGSVMTYFPFPHAARTPKGTGEVGTTAFAVPKGSLAAWGTRLGDLGTQTKTETRFGETWLLFHGPDGDEFALVIDGVDHEGIEIVARRLLAAIAAPLPDHLGPSSITASIGVSRLADDEHLSDTIAAADLAMLAAKRAGRSRIVVA